MARPQTEDGYIRIANELAEAFMRLKLSDQEWRVFWVIIRFSYGWNKKTAVLSLREIGQWTGIDVRHVSTVIGKLVGKRVIQRNGKEFSIQKDYDLWLSPEQESHEQVINITQTGVKRSPERVNATPLAVSNEAGLRTPKDSLNTSFKDISLRERLLKEMKKIFPALSIPDFIPDEKLDFLIYKIGKNEIRADSIKNPLAYLKALTISEPFPSFLEREAKEEKKRQKKRESLEREKKEERQRKANLEVNQKRVKELIKTLGGKGWKTSTRSGTNTVDR